MREASFQRKGERTALRRCDNPHHVPEPAGVVPRFNDGGGGAGGSAKPNGNNRATKPRNDEQMKHTSTTSHQ